MQGEIKLTLSGIYHYWIACPLHKDDKCGTLSLYITVGSRTGRLDHRTGKIISLVDLTKAVDAVSKKFEDGNTGNLEYLPKTLEVLTEKIWDWLEEELGYSVALEKVKLSHPYISPTDYPEYFVEYGRVERELVRQTQPQPQPQPQPKFRKPRKKYKRKRKE